MNYKIYNINEIDMERIVYSEPVTYNENISSIYVSYKDTIRGTSPLLLQIPTLCSIEGIRVINAKSITHELLLYLQSKTTDVTEQVRDFFEGLDRKFIMDAKKKYDWKDSVEKLTYKVLVRQKKNDENGILKIKFIKNNEFETRVFYKDRTIITPDEYHKVFSNKCYVKMIIECVSLWKNKHNIFGLYIRPHQIRVESYTDEELAKKPDIIKSSE